LIKLENIYIIENKEEWATFSEGAATSPKRYPAIGWKRQIGHSVSVSFENIPSTIRESPPNSGYLDIWAKGFDKAFGRFQ
jgi:hypothetical protein